MRWFKHFSDARYNPKFLAIEKRLGEAGYTRAFKLLEIVAANGNSPDKFQPTIDLREPTTDLNWLAGEWKITIEDATKTLDTFAEVRFINPKAWRRQIVKVPQMLEYLDEWTERRQRVKTPERLPSDSRATRVRSRSRVEVEEKKKQKRSRTEKTAAASFEEKANSEEWKSIGITPAGSPEFQEGWKNLYDDSDPSEKLSDCMERMIQLYRNRKALIPPPFYKAKRAVEEQEESESVGHLPVLVDPY